MLSRSACLALACWLVAGSASAQARVRVDGLAALVGGASPDTGVETILRSDVELVARLAIAGGGEDPLRPLARETFAAALDQLVGEVLVAREADRVRVAAPREADVAAERVRIEESVGGAGRLRDLLRELDVPAAEVEILARRRATVAVFLRANLEGTTTISDAEVEAAYAVPGHPFEGEPLDQVREGLRAWLARRALGRAVARWVSLLRGRTVVRVLADLGG